MNPPRTPPTPIFPSLEQLHLDGPEALPWLHLLASYQNGTLRNGSPSTTSNTSTRESLEYIGCPSNTIVDPTLLSSIITFRNLVALRVKSYCSDPEGCTFRLTDNDMENLATALPRLEMLELGRPCGFNSCSNTVASLLSISVHCLNLTVLETHFNTRTIVGDMQRLLDIDAGRDKAKCKLKFLKSESLPFEVDGEDIETVVKGFRAIFPCLRTAGNGSWYEVKYRLRDI